MQVKVTNQSDTEATITVAPTADELQSIKNHVLGHFQQDAKLAGFRPGKAPLEVVEKNVDQTALQQQFLEEAIQQTYPQAVNQLKIRPVSRPEIAVKKFVPFTALEYEATVAVIGTIKLPDYKKIKLTRAKAEVKAKDVDDVIESLRQRGAEKKPVERAAKDGDQVTIDFKGTNAKGEPVKGADGKDYPLLLGSNTFIPGFEENLVGLKQKDEKKFTLTFPKDYGVKALAGKKVTFDVTMKQVEEIALPKVDDTFAASVGPVKTVAQLKDDIKKELIVEKQRQSDMQYESELVKKIADKSEVSIPQVLVDDQVEHMLKELAQNLSYRGQTMQEYLTDQGKTEEELRKDELEPQARERIKASIVLAEIAELEGLEVTPEELEIRLQVLKGQYQDPKMQAELAKPENRREIASRMLTEKTLAKLASFATSK